MSTPASPPVVQMPPTQPGPTRCPCGRTHATWWGRYVQAPSCKLTRQDIEFYEFMNFGKR